MHGQTFSSHLLADCNSVHGAQQSAATFTCREEDRPETIMAEFCRADFGREGRSKLLVGMKGDFSIDKRRSNSKDSLEIIKYIVVKQIVTNGRKLITFTNF